MAVDKDGWIDYEFNSPAAPGQRAVSRQPAWPFARHVQVKNLS